MAKKLWEKNKYIILSAIIFGIAAHGMALLNKFCTFDDAAFLNSVGHTYKSGRWMLDLTEKIHTAILGNGTTLSTPLFNGLLSLIFIAVAACFIIGTLKIKNKYLQMMLSGLMVVFPVITSLFAFMFTAPYYMLSLCVGSFAVWLISQNKRWYCWLVGGIILGCCTGIYQGFIPTFIGLCLLACINEVYSTEGCSFRTIIKIMLYYGGACIVMLISYLLLNKLLLAINNTFLADYKGVSDFGVTSAKGYIKRIIRAYKEFFLLTGDKANSLHPIRTRVYYYAALTLSILLSIFILLQAHKKGSSALQALLLAALICLVPLATEFTYVMCEEKDIWTLMMYGNIIIFVYLVWAADNIGLSRPKNIACGVAAALLLLMNIVYLKYDNICYLKAEILQEEAKSYYTELVTRIQSTEGYNSDMPVIYLNELHKNLDSSITADSGLFDVANNIPYGSYGSYYSINSLHWDVVMKIWTGFDPVIGDVENLGNTERIAELTAYPDEGSIAVIDGNVVVKFY